MLGKLWIILFWFAPVMAADKPVVVVTTTTDLAWAAKRIGKDQVSVTSLLRGTENPHFVDAVPDFIRSVAEAQVVCQVGLDLEVGWMPKVLTKSGNAEVQPGGKGFCEAGKGISVLEKPTGAIDRSLGDVHASGNPHFWLSPAQLAKGAGQIADTLSGVDPAHADFYQKNLQALTTELATLQSKNRAMLAKAVKAYKGPLLVEYHKEFAYFLDAYGLKSFGSIEEKPGVPPSAGRLANVAMSAKGAGVKFAIASEFSPKKTLERFQELSGIPVLTVPVSVQPSGKVKDYPALQAALVEAITHLLNSGGKS